MTEKSDIGGNGNIFYFFSLADNFQWSASEDEDNEDDDNEEKETRSSSKRIGGGNQSGSRISRKSRKVTSPNMNPKKWKHDCDELIKEMCCLPYSVPFREPVSEIEFPDYQRLVCLLLFLFTLFTISIKKSNFCNF